MAEMDLQYDLANDTPANANPVQANFNRIEQFVNQELIRRDGAVAMQGQLALVGDPVSPLDAVPLQFLNQMLPIGIMMMWPGAAAPPGGRWAIANNALVATADYPDLFAVYGYTWGGSGGNFKLPMGAGLMPITPGGTLGGTLGQMGGTKDASVITHDHTINHGHGGANTGNQSASHRHDLANHTHSGSTDTQGAHDHNIGSGAQLYYVEAPGQFEGTPGPGSAGRSGLWTPHNGHWHNVSVGFPSSNTSGYNDTNHVHYATVVDHTGSSGPSGVAGTNLNMPPYAVVNVIVRVL